MTDKKPTSLEDEYFIREDAEKKRKLALQVKKETEAAELARLKALHYMQCPKCGLPMQEVKFKRVDVDVCFACNGIFLEANEIETFQRQINEGRRGVVAAILNWLKPESGQK